MPFDHYFFAFKKKEYITGRKDDSRCTLCSIIRAEAEQIRLVVYETKLSLVSVNLYPYNTGHLIIFPRQHFTDPRQLDAAGESDIQYCTRLCLDALDELYQPSGFNIGYNTGSFSGASIPHLHCHIIPRYKNELGIADLVGGARIIIEDPRISCERLTAWFSEHGTGRSQ